MQTTEDHPVLHGRPPCEFCKSLEAGRSRRLQRPGEEGELAVWQAHPVLGCFTSIILTWARPQKSKIQIVRSEKSIPRGRNSMGKVVQRALEDPPDSHGAPPESCEKWPGKVV